MKISKLPLRIEPGLVALLCAWFYFDPAGTFLPFVCAAALHEAGHLAMLLWLRQPVHSLCLGLQGAVLRTGPLRYRDELLAAAAGPAMNLALLLAFSRTLPRFALVNFCLLAYNLLPFYPLDGGRLLRAVLRNTGLARATWGFLATFVAASALLALVDPGVSGFGDALWCCFQAVTTIGYGDITVTSAVGRAIVVVLSVVGILFVAVLTAAVVSYCNELMLARRNESLALYLDKLEHLDQLTQEELAELSRKVRRLRGSQE